MTTDTLSRLLNIWAELCATAGRQSLRARGALEAGTPAQRAALQRALVALGYPEAMRNASSLGAALRAARGKVDARGRYLGMSHAAEGAIWYVVEPEPELAGGAGAAGGEEVS